LRFSACHSPYKVDYGKGLRQRYADVPFEHICFGIGYFCFQVCPGYQFFCAITWRLVQCFNSFPGLVLWHACGLQGFKEG